MALSLAINALDAGYGAVKALRGVSLHVEAGETVALLGTNGNGKSTLMKCVMGMVRPTRGSVVLKIENESFDLTKLSTEEIVNLGVALVPEGRRLFPRLTVRRNLELGAFTRSDDDEVAAGVDEMFELFPILKERATQLAGTMSGGEQQMLAIARGLMAQPSLLMLDEPSWGIAPMFVTKVLDVIQRVNETGVTILLVEQNLHKALSIAHHGYVIQTGRIVIAGSGHELANNDDVKKAYLGL